MSTFQFGFIGCGNMGGALLSAIAQRVKGAEIGVCERHPEKISSFLHSGRAVEATAKELAAQSRYLFLGVKPQAMTAVFDDIRETLQKRKDDVVLVSMAVGITLAEIEKMAGISCPIIRMMPNTPVQVGEGMILYAVNDLVTEAQLIGFRNGLSKAGRLDKLPEPLMDAAGALSGCGPAFIYLFAEALADGGVECGLTRSQAEQYAAQTLLGSAQMLLSTGENPGKLKDAVCSPGGTTIAGVHALESGAFRATVMDAVCAAFRKTAEFTKK